MEDLREAGVIWKPSWFFYKK